MFKIICKCGNEVSLNPEPEEELDEERSGYYVRSGHLPMTFFEEHDVVGISCDKCRNCVYMFV